MGQNQSQIVDTFIENYVNTSLVSDIISRYATETQSINTNVQNMMLDIDARDIRGDVRAFQKIASIIDVDNMVDRANMVDLTNDIQDAVATELKTAIERVSESFSGLFNTPTNQEIKNRAIAQVDTYVRNNITTDIMDELLIASNNVQDQVVKIKARDITGDLTFDQNIQADIMATNIIESVTDSMVENKAITDLMAAVQSEATSKSTVPSIFSISIPIVVAIIAAIMFAIFLPRGRVAVAISTVILGLIVAFFLWRRNVAS